MNAGTPWHRLRPDEALSRLESNADAGLTQARARARLAELGPNQIAEGRRRSPLAMLAGQFKDFMILVLLAAALISGLIGEPADSIAILVIVILNAGIGALQEFRAERAVAAYRERLSAPGREPLRR